VTLGGATSKPWNSQVGQGSIVAFKTIGSVVIGGDFDGDIISFGGGITSVAITNGSLLPDNLIAAYDGSLGSLTITNGSLLGNVHADRNITSIRVVAGADGVFGDIGVNPASSAAVSYDARRNQLPPGVGPATAVQGPRISAGHNIVSVVVTNGSVFESTFIAGRSIQTVTVTGGAANDPFTAGTGTVFAAADTIDNVTFTGSVSDAVFMAGVLSLGTDGRPGGTGSAADSIKAGTIAKVAIAGTTSRTQFLAGIIAGADGVYATGDDRVALGISQITTLTLGSVGAGVTAWGDVLSSAVAGDGRLSRGGTSLPNEFTDLDSGAGTPGTAFSGARTFTYGSGTVTITTSGPGQFFFNAATGRLTARNTTGGTNITVASSTGSLANFDLVTNDEASLGVVTFQAALTGDSDIVVDGGVTTLALANYGGTGTILLGGAAGTISFADFTGGYLQGASVQTLRVAGQYGASNPLTLGEVNMQFISAGTITITGAARGTISVDRDVTSLVISGVVDRSSFRVGQNLGTFTAPSLSRTLVSAGDAITAVTVGGEVFGSSIMAGLDLGRDAAFDSNALDVGGEGLAADVLSTGSIGTVTIAGSFRESNLVAGYYRNRDGFFGTSDDNLASGRSSIGAVTIGGSQVGSTRSTESYRIASTGTVGLVRIGGAPFSGSFGNFALETPLLAPQAVQVVDTRVTSDAGVFLGEIIFNQPVDASTISRSLSVSEVRGNGSVEIRLIEGADFTLSYNTATSTASVVFSRTLTSANLPQVPGRPGPGVFRFFVNASTLRPKLVGQPLDGDGDGNTRPGDNYIQDVVVGDAGDKLAPSTVTTGGVNVDFYGPSNLDFVMDKGTARDGLPDANRTVTVRGAIGDHPDANVNFFSFASDVDIYAVTLQAGQILRLGALQGPGSRAGFTVLGPTGQAISRFANNAFALSLPTDRGDPRDFTFAQSFLIKTTGTYYLAVGNTAGVTNAGNAAFVPNIATPPGGLGAYSFTVSIFDDGDSGFTSSTDSGDGTSVVAAPAPIAFAGNDQVFGTADDQAQIVIGAFTFTHSRGTDNLPNTADDVVTGTDGRGITSTRTGTGELTQRIESAIGPRGHVGVPLDIASDVDIYHLNNRQPIAPNTPMRITVKLADLGANLGSAIAATQNRNATRTVIDNRGFVQFGLFDVTGSTSVDDGLLVFSPTDFRATAGKANTVIADNGSTKYGFDSNGDFYVDFVTPDRLGVPGASAAYAIYLQGSNNSDYSIEVTTRPQTASAPTPVRQNFFIETNGGTVNWLQVGGVTTELAAFDARTLGFAGQAAGGLPVRDYLINQVVAQLNSVYQGAGLDVRFSANPTDFGDEQFSTIYLSSTNDPIIPIFDPFTQFNFDFISQQFFSTQPYGFSQRSDPLNANLEDEGVVFVPSFSLNGFTPSLADLDRFSQSLTGAVGRRAGELMGLRLTQQYGAGGPFDAMASNSPTALPGTGLAYTLPQAARGLSDAFDATQSTDFFLGRQSAVTLLQKFISLR
jgi:hypothetical protein